MGGKKVLPMVQLLSLNKMQSTGKKGTMRITINNEYCAITEETPRQGTPDYTQPTPYYNQGWKILE